MIRAEGRIVELKVHRALWTGAHPQNSLDGLRECYAARVGRAEIDFRWHQGELVMAHDEPRTGDRPPTLAEALEIVRDAPPGPTLLMLDAKDEDPWRPELALRLARLIEPVRERVFVGTPADWNLRRLRAVDPDVALTFDPMYYIEKKGSRERMPRVEGAYGYRDAHPLALRRTVPTAEYLRERLQELLRVVPGITEMHIRLSLFEQMVEDGLDVAAVVHDAGVHLDTWTLDAGTPRWRERLEWAVGAGADIVTSNTPREMSAAMAALA